MSLLDTIMKGLGGDAMSQLSQRVGADENTTRTAVGAALPTLLGAISRNASSETGASSLHGALERHDGSVLDNPAKLFAGGDTSDGEGILRHVLGGKQSRIETGLSQATGLDKGGTKTLLSSMAPLVMGALGREQKTGGLDVSSLAGLLQKERSSAEAAAPKEMGLVGKLLDADGDGDVDLGDFIKKGTGALGGLFSR